MSRTLFPKIAGSGHIGFPALSEQRDTALYVRPYSADQMFTGTLTDAQALGLFTNGLLLASTNETKIASTGRTSIHTTYPYAKVLVYDNASFFMKASADPENDAWVVAAYGEGFLAHETAALTSGGRLRSAAYNANRLANISHPMWTNFLYQDCLVGDLRLGPAPTALDNRNFDGIFMDIASYWPGTPNYCERESDGAVAVAYNSRTGADYTMNEWMTWCRHVGTAMVRKLQVGSTPRLVVGNVFENYFRYYHATSPTSLQGKGFHAGMAEQFVRNATDAYTAYRTETDWAGDVGILFDEGAAGRVVLTMTKLRPGGTPWSSNALYTGYPDPVAQRWHKFSLASFLLASNGHHMHQFTYGEGTRSTTDPDQGSGRMRHPWWSAPIGVPSQVFTATSQAKVGGTNSIYRRNFSHGIVLVHPNGSGSDQVVSLGGTYHKIDDWNGTDWVVGAPNYTSVTLAPNTAEIMVAP